MICSPCKNCHRKDLPKDKCVGNCQILKSIQEIDSSFGNVNEGCGIDYTEEYGCHIPSASRQIIIGSSTITDAD